MTSRSSIPDESRIVRLGRYNDEVSHGLVHTDEWREHMREEQAWFDDRRQQEMIEQGGEEISPGLWILPRQPKRRWWRFGF